MPTMTQDEYRRMRDVLDAHRMQQAAEEQASLGYQPQVEPVQPVQPVQQPEPVQPVQQSVQPVQQSGTANGDDAAFQQALNAVDWSKVRPERTLGGTLKDAGVTLANAAIGAGEGVVGLANLATLGGAGKVMDSIGYDAKAARDYLNQYKSAAQKFADREVEEAGQARPGEEGFGGAVNQFGRTLGAMWENPSTILTTAVESAPSMFLGGAVGKGAVKAASAIQRAKAAGKIGEGAATRLASKIVSPGGVVNDRAAGILAGVGEGVVAGGMQAEQIRQESPDRELTPRGILSAAAAGTFTGILGRIGNKISKRLGVTDVEKAIVSGVTGSMARTAGGTAGQEFKKMTAGQWAKAVTGGAITEGLFEELPQSAQEQFWTNFALERPLWEGIGAAAAQGMAAGMVMGGAANVYAGRESKQRETWERELARREEAAREKAAQLEALVREAVENSGQGQVSGQLLRGDEEEGSIAAPTTTAGLSGYDDASGVGYMPVFAAQEQLLAAAQAEAQAEQQERERIQRIYDSYTRPFIRRSVDGNPLPPPRASLQDAVNAGMQPSPPWSMAESREGTERAREARRQEEIARAQAEWEAEQQAQAAQAAFSAQDALRNYPGGYGYNLADLPQITESRRAIAQAEEAAQRRGLQAYEDQVLQPERAARSREVARRGLSGGPIQRAVDAGGIGIGGGYGMQNPLNAANADAYARNAQNRADRSMYPYRSPATTNLSSDFSEGPESAEAFVRRMQEHDANQQAYSDLFRNASALEHSGLSRQEYQRMYSDLLGDFDEAEARRQEEAFQQGSGWRKTVVDDKLRQEEREGTSVAEAYNDIEKQGIAITDSPFHVKARDLRRGDRIVIRGQDGLPDIATVRGYDDHNRMVIEDGVKYLLKPDSRIPVEGVRLAGEQSQTAPGLGYQPKQLREEIANPQPLVPEQRPSGAEQPYTAQSPEEFVWRLGRSAAQNEERQGEAAQRRRDYDRNIAALEEEYRRSRGGVLLPEEEAYLEALRTAAEIPRTRRQSETGDSSEKKTSSETERASRDFVRALLNARLANEERLRREGQGTVATGDTGAALEETPAPEQSGLGYPLLPAETAEEGRETQDNPPFYPPVSATSTVPAAQAERRGQRGGTEQPSLPPGTTRRLLPAPGGAQEAQGDQQGQPVLPAPEQRLQLPAPEGQAASQGLGYPGALGTSAQNIVGNWANRVNAAGRDVAGVGQEQAVQGNTQTQTAPSGETAGSAAAENLRREREAFTGRMRQHGSATNAEGTSYNLQEVQGKPGLFRVTSLTRGGERVTPVSNKGLPMEAAIKRALEASEAEEYDWWLVRGTLDGDGYATDRFSKARGKRAEHLQALLAQERARREEAQGGGVSTEGEGQSGQGIGYPGETQGIAQGAASGETATQENPERQAFVDRLRRTGPDRGRATANGKVYNIDNNNGRYNVFVNDNPLLDENGGGKSFASYEEAVQALADAAYPAKKKGKKAGKGKPATEVPSGTTPASTPASGETGTAQTAQRQGRGFGYPPIKRREGEKTADYGARVRAWQDAKARGDEETAKAIETRSESGTSSKREFVQTLMDSGEAVSALGNTYRLVEAEGEPGAFRVEVYGKNGGEASDDVTFRGVTREQAANAVWSHVKGLEEQVERDAVQAQRDKAKVRQKRAERKLGAGKGKQALAEWARERKAEWDKRKAQWDEEEARAEEKSEKAQTLPGVTKRAKPPRWKGEGLRAYLKRVKEWWNAEDAGVLPPRGANESGKDYAERVQAWQEEQAKTKAEQGENQDQHYERVKQAWAKSRAEQERQAQELAEWRAEHEAERNRVLKSFAEATGIPLGQLQEEYEAAEDGDIGDEIIKQGFLAPNGEHTNLTVEQWMLARLPSFKERYGDWENGAADVSLVLDANGEPVFTAPATVKEAGTETKAAQGEKSAKPEDTGKPAAEITEMPDLATAQKWTMPGKKALGAYGGKNYFRVDYNGSGEDTGYGDWNLTFFDFKPDVANSQKPVDFGRIQASLDVGEDGSVTGRFTTADGSREEIFNNPLSYIGRYDKDTFAFDQGRRVGFGVTLLDGKHVDAIMYYALKRYGVNADVKFLLGDGKGFTDTIYETTVPNGVVVTVNGNPFALVMAKADTSSREQVLKKVAAYEAGVEEAEKKKQDEAGEAQANLPVVLKKQRETFTEEERKEQKSFFENYGKGLDPAPPVSPKQMTRSSSLEKITKDWRDVPGKVRETESGYVFFPDGSVGMRTRHGLFFADSCEKQQTYDLATRVSRYYNDDLSDVPAVSIATFDTEQRSVSVEYINGNRSNISDPFNRGIPTQTLSFTGLKPLALQEIVSSGNNDDNTGYYIFVSKDGGTTILNHTAMNVIAPMARRVGAQKVQFYRTKQGYVSVFFDGTLAAFVAPFNEKSRSLGESIRERVEKNSGLAKEELDRLFEGAVAPTDLRRREAGAEGNKAEETDVSGNPEAPATPNTPEAEATGDQERPFDANKPYWHWTTEDWNKLKPTNEKDRILKEFYLHGRDVNGNTFSPSLWGERDGMDVWALTVTTKDGKRVRDVGATQMWTTRANAMKAAGAMANLGVAEEATPVKEQLYYNGTALDADGNVLEVVLEGGKYTIAVDNESPAPIQWYGKRQEAIAAWEEAVQRAKGKEGAVSGKAEATGELPPMADRVATRREENAALDKEARDYVQRGDDESPSDAQDYESRVKLYKDIVQGKMNVPESSGFAMPDTREGLSELAQRVEDVLREKAPADWQGDIVRTRALAHALWDGVFDKDNDATYAAMDLLYEAFGIDSKGQLERDGVFTPLAERVEARKSGKGKKAAEEAGKQEEAVTAGTDEPAAGLRNGKNKTEEADNGTSESGTVDTASTVSTLREDNGTVEENSAGVLGTVSPGLRGNAEGSGDSDTARNSAGSRRKYGTGNLPAGAGRNAVSAGGRAGSREVHNAPAGTRRRRGEQRGNVTELPANIPAQNFAITPELGLGEGGPVQKFNNNLAAIRTLKQIQAEGRRATPEEQAVLAKYVGWGGIPDAFRNAVTGEIKKGWENRVEELEALLTPEELKAALDSVLNAHYTSQDVVQAIWQGMEQLGFRGGLVLEPSVGTGNFLGLLPQNFAGETRFVAAELDNITAGIAQLLYPHESIYNTPFESLALPSNYFDAMVGNPPFGNISLTFPNLPSINRFSMHNQFVLASLDALAPGGLQAFVVSRFLMDAQKSTDVRKMIADQANLLGAIRLPGTAFLGNANTEVVTDLIFLQKKTNEEQEKWDRHRAANGGKDSIYPDWVFTQSFETKNGEKLVVNRWFGKHPEHVLGEMNAEGKMNAKGDLGVTYSGNDFGKDLMQKVKELLPKNVAVRHSGKESSENAYLSMMNHLDLSLADEESGSISFNDDGQVVQVYDQRTKEGDSILTERVLEVGSPWKLEQDYDGRWFEYTDKVDENGRKVKVVKTVVDKETGEEIQKTTNYNVKEEKYYQEDELPVGRKVGETLYKKIQAAINLIDLTQRQRQLEGSFESSDEEIESNRTKLNAAYDAFVKKYGYLNASTNSFLDDVPNGPLIMALESSYRKKRGGMPERAKKSAILSRRVIFPYKAETRASGVEDALGIVLSEDGRVDLARMGELLGKDEQAFISEMFEQRENPLIFQDPERGKWVTAGEYLGGNVRRKLNAAKAALKAAREDGDEKKVQQMEKNVRALEAVQPEPWPSSQIKVIMGASWIPLNVYEEFFSHLTGESVQIDFFKQTSKFFVNEYNGSREHSGKYDNWSTRRRSAADLFTAILNSRTLRILDSEGHLDVNATEEARIKTEQMKEEFNNWIFADTARRQRLTEIFNDNFNVIQNKQYDGSHLKMPGKVPDEVIKLRRNQVNAVWRGIIDRFVLYDHVVGAGKTFTGIARAMERKRMGLSRKPMIIVPNHLVGQFTADVYRLYPGANVLSAAAEDASPVKRRKLFARIATGDWDIVIMPHSSFEFISIDKATEERFIKEELEVAKAALQEQLKRENLTEQDVAAAEGGGKNKPKLPPSVKEAVRFLRRLEERLKKLLQSGRNKDKLMTFEQMGIDDLTVDEAHLYKNLFYHSAEQAAGMGNKAGSNRAFDLYNKVRVLRENGGSVAFMTGTPVSNSAVELYTMMRYLAAEELRESGLENFDDWRRMYVEIGLAFEPNETGTGLKAVTRLGREWNNMRSMMDMYRLFADTVSNDDIQRWYKEDTGKDFPLPRVRRDEAGNPREVVPVKPTPRQMEEIQRIADELENVDDISDINIRMRVRFRLMDQARKISLDIRALYPTAEGEAGGKLDQASDRIARIYREYDAVKGTQLVFLDRSVPHGKGDEKDIVEYKKLLDNLEKAERDGDSDKISKLEERIAKIKLKHEDISEMLEAWEAQKQHGKKVWNGYQQIKDNLIRLGIPANEIRFVQEAKDDTEKQALFEQVRNGEVRVLIGSTAKMGAGTNVQDRLVALHHIDVGWKPSDIEQREGRIIRQGNLFATETIDGEANPLYDPNFEVRILAYGTTPSMDSKMWALNATKLKMIAALRQYSGEFTMEFDDSDTMSAAAVAAELSGNPAQIRRFELISQISKLEAERNAFSRNKIAAEDNILKYQQILKSAPKELAFIKKYREKAVEGLKAAVEYLSGLSITVDGQRYSGEQGERRALTDYMENLKRGVESGSEKSRVEVDGKTYTINNGYYHVIDTMGDPAPFVFKMGGETLVSRSSAKRHIAGLAKQALDNAGVGTTKDEVALGMVKARNERAGDFVASQQPLGTFTLNGIDFDLNFSAYYDHNRVGEPRLYVEFGFEQKVEGDVPFSIKATVNGVFTPSGEIDLNSLGAAFYDIQNDIEKRLLKEDSAIELQKRLENAEKSLPDVQEIAKAKWPKEDLLKEKRKELKAVEERLASGETETAEPQAGVEGADDGVRQSQEPTRAKDRPVRRDGETLVDYKARLKAWRDRLKRDVQAAVDMVRKLVPGLTVKTTTDLDRELGKLKGKVRHLRNADGQIVGAYHAGSKTVLLTPDADAGTVLHEIGWHAMYDWAKANAPELYRQMRRFALEAPEEVQAWVKERYGRFSAEGLLDEIGAKLFTDQGREEFENAVKSRASRRWYQRLADFFRELWGRFTGAHRADLGAYRDLTPEAAMKRLLSDILEGRRFGEQGGVRSEERGAGRGDMLVRFAKELGVTPEQLQREYDAVVAKYRDTPQWRKAPNGEDSKLNERQWVLVRTPRFKSWFGDWENDPDNASKVVDANGEPLVVHRGTPEKMGYVFEYGRNFYGGNKGFWFTSSESAAKDYAFNDITGEIGETKAVFLNARSIMDLTPLGRNTTSKRFNDYVREHFGIDLGRGSNKEFRVNELYERSQDKLYPGSHRAIKMADVGHTYIVKYSNQIKSATDNTGAFDPENPDIRYSFLGERGAAALDQAEEATTRLDNLAIARQMEEAGKDAKTVKLATGWERGKDGKWRYEIADGKLVPDAEVGADFSTGYWKTTLGRLYDAPELFKAYPELKNMAVEFAELEDGERGKFVRRGGASGRESVIKMTVDYIVLEDEENAKTRIAEIERTPEFKKMIRAAGPNADAIYDEWLASDLGQEHDRLKKGAKEARVKGEALNTLVHEIQHAIQNVEGFARGGSPRGLTDYERTARVNKLHAQSQDIERQHRGAVQQVLEQQLPAYLREWTDVEVDEKGKFSEPYNIGGRDVNSILEMAQVFTDQMIDKRQNPETALAEIVQAADGAVHDFFEAEGVYDKSFPELDRITEKYKAKRAEMEAISTGTQDPLKTYQRLAGEAESRNVERRLSMTPEQRRASLAEETEDVAREDQIVLNEMLGNAASIGTERNRLVTLHNLSEESLLFADKLGGLPVPSLGITKAETPYSGFGDISLIGTSSMIDPEQTPVFSADAYSSRFPKPIYAAVKSAKVEAFREKMQESFGLVGENLELDRVITRMTEEPDKDNAVSRFMHSNGGRVAYLKSKGQAFEPVMKEPEEREPGSMSPEVQAVVQRIIRDKQPLPRQSDFPALTEALRAWANRTFGKAETKKWMANVVDANGLLHFGIANNLFSAAKQDAEKIGKQVVDHIETGKKLEKLVSPKDPGLKRYAEKQVAALFGAPKIELNGKKVAMTLENVVKAMVSSNVRGQEKTMTFGPAQVHAGASRQFRDMGELRDSRGRVVAPEEARAARADLDNRMKEYAGDLVDYYAYPSIREAMDDAMRALTEAAKDGGTKDALKAALQKLDFKRVPDYLVEDGVELLDGIKSLMVSYYEAKPQRSVKLSEFAGAVVPSDISPEARAALERAGLRIREYDRNEKDGREKATAALSAELNKERGDVLYRKRATPVPVRDRADIEAELEQELGAARARKLTGTRNGRVAIVDSQEEARRIIGEDTSTAKQAQNGTIQGFFKDGKVYLVRDGIAKGQTMPVLMHELGEHAAQLGFANDVKYRAILKSLENRKDEKSANGEAIRAAMQRAEDAGLMQEDKHYWSEVAAYMVEQYGTKKASLLDKIVNFFKNLLYRVGAISADRFSQKNLALFAQAAVRAEARRAERAGERDTVRYSFAGERGAAALDQAEEATTRLDNLAVAREMEEAGKDAKTVKLATGWERGKDGKWRYEIDDTANKVDLSAAENGEATLAEVLDAPELFKVYPQLRRFDVELANEDDMPPGAYGAYYPGRDLIRIVRALRYDDEGAKSVLHHEIQHAIQDIEGFALGALIDESAKQKVVEQAAPYWQDVDAHIEFVDNVRRQAVYSYVQQARRFLANPASFEKSGDSFKYKSMVGPKGGKERRAYLEDAIDRWRRDMEDEFNTLEFENGYMLREAQRMSSDELKSALGKLKRRQQKLLDGERKYREAVWEQERLEEMEPWELYRRLAGETEARNVQRRMNMTPEERRASLASETEDVAREDQIVLQGMLGGAAASVLFQAAPTSNSGIRGWIDRLLDNAKPDVRDRWERFVYNFLDTNDPRERIWAAAGKDADHDIVTVERLRGKKAAAESEAFRERMVKPLLATLAKAKLKASDLEEYAHALHTPERNQRMREVNAKRYLDSLLHQMTGSEAKPFKDQIELIQKQATQAGWTSRDKHLAYLQMMDQVFADIPTRELVVQAMPDSTEREQKLKALAAKRLERTKRIKEKWDEESPRFAGMTDKEAQSIIVKWHKDSRFAKLQDAHSQLRDITKMTLAVLHEGGELSDEEYDDLLNGYLHYVPLHRAGFMDTAPATGRITGPTGKPLKVAKGSMREVVNILPEVLKAHETAISRKHKLLAGRVLYEWALANPDAGITVESIPKEPTHDKEGNIVMYPSQQEPPDGVFVKVDGQKHLLRFAVDPKTPEGRTMERFLDSIKGTDAQLGGITKGLHKITRWLAAVNTMYSPEFVISNFARDLQTAFVHLNQEDINMDGLQKQVLSDIPKALRGIWQSERGKGKGKEWSNWYKDFAAHGGKVGWMQGYEGIDEIVKTIGQEMKLAGDGHHLRKGFENVKNFIESANKAVENCLRLATYKAMVERGVARDRAARVASGLTVDFTQHGKLGPQINALYLFFNASVQGTVRMGQAMAKSKRVRQIAGALAGLGFMLQMLALAGGGDDDTGEPYILGIPEYERQRSIIIMLPGQDGRYIKIPKAYGYGALYDFGAELANSIYMSATGRKYDHAKGAMRVVSSFANSFNPVHSATVLQTIAPTLVDPAVYVAENKTWSGQPLMPEQNPFGPQKPDSQRVWKSTGPAWRTIAETANSLTGGDTYEGGLIDVSPETLEMLWDNALGSAGRFVGNVAHLPATLMQDDTDISKVPFARTVTGKWSDRTISNRYHDVMERAQIANMRFKNAETLEERRRIFQGDDYILFRRTHEIDKRVKRLRNRLNQIEAAGNTAGAEYIQKQILSLQKRALQMAN